MNTWVIFVNRTNNGVTCSNTHRLLEVCCLRTVGVGKLIPKFVGLYNANSSLMGELRYLRTKLTKSTSCSLCDLTHGWNPFEKSSWKTACKDLGVPIDLLHKNDANPEQLLAIDSLPAIVRFDGNCWVQVMDSNEIASYRNAPRGLLAALKQL